MQGIAWERAAFHVIALRDGCVVKVGGVRSLVLEDLMSRRRGADQVTDWVSGTSFVS